MTQKFLNYIDEATNFGLNYIPSAMLLKMFGEKNRMSPASLTNLRINLENKGIL